MYNKTLEFPYNIASDVLRDDIEINKDEFEKNFYYICDKIFTEYEKDIIFSKYRDNISLRDLSIKYGCSYEWIRRHLRRILKKLRSDDINNYLITGIEPDRKPIEYLKISIRTYNGLIINGFKYIDEIVKMKKDDIIAMNEIGNKAYEEIMEEVKRLGYNTEQLKYSQKIKDSLIHIMKMYNIDKQELLKYSNEIED